MSKFKIVEDIKFMDIIILKIGDEVEFIDDILSISTKFGIININKSDIYSKISKINDLNFKYSTGSKKYRMQLDINCTEIQLEEIEKEISKIIHKII